MDRRRRLHRFLEQADEGSHSRGDQRAELTDQISRHSVSARVMRKAQDLDSVAAVVVERRDHLVAFGSALPACM